jgi:hypothetical protein
MTWCSGTLGISEGSIWNGRELLRFIDVKKGADEVAMFT